MNDLKDEKIIKDKVIIITRFLDKDIVD